MLLILCCEYQVLIIEPEIYNMALSAEQQLVVLRNGNSARLLGAPGKIPQKLDRPGGFSLCSAFIDSPRPAGD